MQHAYIHCSAIRVKYKYAAVKCKYAYKCNCSIDCRLLITFLQLPANFISMRIRQPTLHRCRTERSAVLYSMTERRCWMLNVEYPIQ